MVTNYYLPTDDAGKSVWLSNLNNKLPGYATLFNIPAATVTQVGVDTKNFATIMLTLELFRSYSPNLTVYKNLLRDGTGTGQPIGVLAPAPANPAFQGTPILGDIFGRVAKLVQTIKSSTNYTENIGQDLKIIGSETPALASKVLKPNLTVKLVSGHPVLKWKKGKTNAMKLCVDRGEGAYVLLTTATLNNYTDNSELPAMGKAALWKYMGIYIKKDEEAGDWSDAIEISVSGTP